jgi:geranyl-CoA carboxylase alpha subunit
LAENADFARACADAGLNFIGPPPAAMELMGDKRAAKRAMKEAKVPCVPGYEDADQATDVLTAAAEGIGFPVMVKAAAGGGGRGMRRVESLDALADAIRGARSEAENAFGDGTLLLEKAIDGARHVEIQVLADSFGNVIHLGERDCSVQRRHQKVFEECPSPAVDDALRARMGQAAVEAAKACGYVGAGTVEFLLDADGEFYFLEMNTRLQVEHPVTEAVTGIDLVEEQLRVAEGEALGIEQGDVVFEGHAIEARFYAEDAERGFLPQTGTLLRWEPPGTIRADAGVTRGSEISPHYDPMIAKLIAFGITRQEALRKLEAGLRQTVALGVVTNKAFLLAVCQHPTFASGKATTAFVPSDLAGHPCLTEAPPSPLSVATAALVVTLEGARGLVEDPSFIGWRSGGPVWSAVHLRQGDNELETRVSAVGGARFVVEWDEDRRVELELAADDGHNVALLHDGVRRSVAYEVDGDRLWLDDGDGARVFVNTTHQPAESADASGSGRLTAPLDGAVTELAAAVGDVVAKGQLVLVLEAMKMEHRIVADADGKLETLLVNVGQQVKTRQLLAEITVVSEQES